MHFHRIFGVIAILIVRAHSNEVPVKLEIQPNSATVQKQIGASLALTCKPSTQELITELEWKDAKNKRIETTTQAAPVYIKKLSGEPGLVLIFASLSTDDAGTYTCSAKYANTEYLETNITVTTYEEISFVDAPESQYPHAGKDFLIKCKVQANPAPTVEWMLNDQTIISNERYVVETEGLLVKNVKESDDGVYKCSALVWSTGQVSTRNIKVEVVIPPKIHPLEDIELIEGNTASTRCNAMGKPPPTYRWIKETTHEDLSKHSRFDVRATTGDLTVDKVEAGDDGTYRCIAENIAGSDNVSTHINVLIRPRIYELLNVTAPVGNETQLVCKTHGRPMPQVTFRKRSSKERLVVGQQKNDKRIIVEQEFVRDKDEAYARLIVTSLNRSDDGLYECIADNKAGTAYKNGHITVEFAPTFERTKNFPSAWSWANRPGNLTCLPEAIPNATIIWKYNGQPISKDTPIFKVVGTGPISHLIVRPNQDHRYYTKYECVATNRIGEKSIFLELKEGKVPEHLMQIKTDTLTATTIKFRLEPPQYFDSLPIKSFIVQYRLEELPSWDYAYNHTWSFNAPYILENLIPQKTYAFRFAAVNEVGIGPFTNAPAVSMPPRSEPAEPKILKSSHNIVEGNASDRNEVIFVSPYADKYELRWNVPNDNGDPIDSYLVRYCVTEKVNGDWKDLDCSEEIKQSVQYTNYIIDTLQPDTTYKIELRAHNAIGSSSPAQIRVRTARGSDPPIPYNQPSVSSATIIGVAVCSVLLILIFVDLTCFAVNRAGILALICNRNKAKQQQEEDPKLGSLYSWRFPLPYCSYKAAPAHPNSLNLPMPVKLAPTPTDEREPLKQDYPSANGDKSNMTVEFDGTTVYSKTGEIIGKHSAV